MSLLSLPPPTSLTSALLLPLPRLRPPSLSRRTWRLRARCMGRDSSPVREFPYLPRPHRELMASLLSAIDARVGPTLLPSAVPPDVLSFQSPTGTSHGALDIRSGGLDSPVDFILESWLHCEIPMGSLNITTLFAFLSTSTDAPHILMEFIQSSPTSLVLLLDLLPRKDLVLHPDYLHEFYEETNLDKQRQELEKLPQVQPFCSSSLYIRSVLSPTAIAVQINCGADGRSIMEEIMSGPMDSAAKELIRIWLDKCASSSKQLEDTERADLIKRDSLMMNKTIEIDLTSNLPRLFGSDVVNRVMDTLQKASRI